jgi:hypothetical protein
MTMYVRSMKMKNRWLPGLVLSLLSIIAVVSAPSGGGAANRERGETAHLRWDIVSVQPPNVLPGGHASALANDGSTITITGSGTFEAGDAEDVTGGGTWKTSGPIGTRSGTYEVTALVSFNQAPGTFPPLNDLIGNPAEASAGLVVLRIQYSDGSRGILVVSCSLVGTPANVFEGVTATKGAVDFWNRVPPVDGVDANRTLFHVQ